MQMHVCEAADGRLSVIHIDPLLVSFPPPLNLQMVESSQLPLHIYQKAGRHMAAWSQSRPCICSIWFSHRNMIYVAFCMQSLGRWLRDSHPLLHCCSFRLILLLLWTEKCSCLGQIGSKTRGNSTSYTSEEIRNISAFCVMGWNKNCLR